MRRRRPGSSARSGAGQFAFAHALVRHAVLDELSGIRLARLHWGVGEALERDDPSRRGEIAFHYAAGSDVGDAATVVRTALDAGDDALQRLAFDEAAHNFRTALAATERTAADVELRDRVLRGLGTALNAWRTSLTQAGVAASGRLGAASGRSRTAVHRHRRLPLCDPDRRRHQAPSPPRRVARSPRYSPLRACALGWRAMPGGRGRGGDAERASRPATTRRRTDGERGRRNGASNGERSGSCADVAISHAGGGPGRPRNVA